MMIRYEFDDGGRSRSGRRGKAGDCVCRALAILTGRPYEDCYRALAEAELKHGRKGVRSARDGVCKKARNEVYAAFGLVKRRLPAGPRPTWSEAHEAFGDCIVSSVRHVACLKDGGLRDTFDGRTYLWEDRLGNRERRERKARSVWVLAGGGAAARERAEPAQYDMSGWFDGGCAEYALPVGASSVEIRI